MSTVTPAEPGLNFKLPGCSRRMTVAPCLVPPPDAASGRSGPAGPRAERREGELRDCSDNDHTYDRDSGPAGLVDGVAAGAPAGRDTESRRPRPLRSHGPSLTVTDSDRDARRDTATVPAGAGPPAAARVPGSRRPRAACARCPSHGGAGPCRVAGLGRRPRTRTPKGRRAGACNQNHDF